MKVEPIVVPTMPPASLRRLRTGLGWWRQQRIVPERGSHQAVGLGSPLRRPPVIFDEHPVAQRKHEPGPPTTQAVTFITMDRDEAVRC
jgi:hypothetical protein